MNHDFFIDKSCGTLLGVAVGDALGAPVEGLKPGHIRTLFKTLDRYVSVDKLLKKGIKFYRESGLYTDDTQQMLTVCEILLNKGDMSTDALARLFASLCTDDSCGGFGVFRGTGGFFRRTMHDLLDGIPWEQAAGATAGCMAAVRIPPVVIKYFDDPIRLTRAVIEASLVTHKDPIGISAAIMQAFLIRGLLPLTPGAPLDIPALFASCKEYCEQGEQMLASNYKHLIVSSHPEGIYAVSSMIGTFAGLIGRKNRQNIEEYIFDYASHYSSMPVHKLTVPFSLTLVPLAIATFFMNSGSFADTIIESINAGGDTDTLAALTGALAGAYWGMDNIPDDWLTGLSNMNQIKIRGEALVTGTKGLDIKPLFDMEKKLTRHESDQAQKYMSALPQKKSSKPKKPKPAEPLTADDADESPIPKKEDKGARRAYERDKSIRKKERRKNKTITQFDEDLL